MKLTPSGSPLKSAQMHFKGDFKTTHLVKGQRSYEAVKITHTFTMASGLTTAALNILNSHFMVTNTAVLQYNVQSCMYLH